MLFPFNRLMFVIPRFYMIPSFWPLKWTPVFGPLVKVDSGVVVLGILWRHQGEHDGADTTTIRYGFQG